MWDSPPRPFNNGTLKLWEANCSWIYAYFSVSVGLRQPTTKRCTLHTPRADAMAKMDLQIIITLTNVNTHNKKHLWWPRSSGVRWVRPCLSRAHQPLKSVFAWCISSGQKSISAITNKWCKNCLASCSYLWADCSGSSLIALLINGKRHDMSFAWVHWTTQHVWW